MSQLFLITKKAKLPQFLFTISLLIMGSLGVIYVIESIYFGKVLDAAGTSLSSVKSAIFIIFLITLIEYVLGIVSKYTVARFSEIGMFNLRNSLSQKISHLKYKVYDEASTGDILSRTMSDLNGIGAFWSDTFINLFQDFFVFTTGLFVCLYISLKLTLVGFIFIPIVSYIIFKTSSIVEKASYDSRKFSGKMNSLAHNILMGMMTLKAFTLEDIMSRKFNETSKDFIKAEKKVGIASAKVYAIGSLIDYGPNIAVIILAGIMSINNMLTSGEYLTFTFTFGFVSNVLYDLQRYIISYRNSEAMARRLMGIYAYEDEKLFEIKAKESLDNPIINISNLSFSYSENHKILDSINLKINKNEVVAFVGASGSGKSTLVKEISGMYDIPSGDAEVAGFKIKEENIPSIRNQIAIVSQESYLFPVSVIENVRYGKPDASDEEVIEACKKADIHDFIMEQPNKYKTLVGEKGIYMSGGQRQRISIARAFLKNANILILDEPTSALDSESEKNIQYTLDKLMNGKTVIIVAHRLSTIINANLIYVFDKGTLKEKGSHEDLVLKQGYYYNLYKKQFENNQEEETA
ncbi:ABC transporter ATP-binding protein [Clostridium sp. 'White wine YQ']|uniref:ABC transporter ATP-binding protein n=1 Tax=Clostridium sp. 'White wine YQ' TaxID=3027474 RepID=UPI002365ECA6|nr:ABC transporter ATP-binding protein [Clostridium sp. 'White wine YQ']MDD7793600.1 ABC transporter ATP-binding protein [Clostridium sp. 'White wine YQ']